MQPSHKIIEMAVLAIQESVGTNNLRDLTHATAMRDAALRDEMAYELRYVHRAMHVVPEGGGTTFRGLTPAGRAWAVRLPGVEVAS